MQGALSTPLTFGLHAEPADIIHRSDGARHIGDALGPDEQFVGPFEAVFQWFRDALQGTYSNPT
jgi:hypothetical protein